MGGQIREMNACRLWRWRGGIDGTRRQLTEISPRQTLAHALPSKAQGRPLRSALSHFLISFDHGRVFDGYWDEGVGGAGGRNTHTRIDGGRLSGGGGGDGGSWSSKGGNPP